MNAIGPGDGERRDGAVESGEREDAPAVGRPGRRGGRIGGSALAAVPLAVLALVVYLVPLPYFVVGPGPVRDVQPLIRVRVPRVSPGRGHYLLTAVHLRRANAYDLLAAWVDAEESTLPERDVLAPGETPEEEERVARSQMDTSKIDAAIVALRAYAGYPRRHRPGALVERVFSGTPADGRLFPGDLIVAVDGRPVAGPSDVGARIRAAGAGTRVRLTIRGRGHGPARVALRPRRIRGVDRPVIGVNLVQNFPFPVAIRSNEIGGPSAGLAWALGLTELLAHRDLSRGRTIAATGELDADGRVHPVGGIASKVAAARRAGATVFFVPRRNAEEARRVAGTMSVVPVATYRDALTYLTAPRRVRAGT